MAYIDKKLDEYNQELSEADENKEQQVKQEINKYSKRKDDYHNLENQIRQNKKHK